jgi:hypothetical protein
VNTGLRTWFDKAGPLGQSLAILAAVAALLALGFAVWRGVRALRGKKAADVLTVVAAAMASSVAATGMWHFFSRTMHLPVWIQATLFAFMEISVLASALRARANVARDGEAGADGLAVWVLTSASGLMSASEAASVQEALVRLGAPLVAAWLWERSMVPERRAQKAAKGTAEAAVRWLFSVKRVAVRLGLATALGADLETEDANRRIDRFVRADNRAQRAGRLTRSRATRRRDRAHARLMEQARMQADPRALYTHLGRQAILDVLARLGGDDAVIDRERARQMQHILADATGATPGNGAAGAAGAAEPQGPVGPADPAEPADDTPSAHAPATAAIPPAAPVPPARQPAPQPTATAQPAAAQHAPLDPMVLQPPRQAVPAPAAEAERPPSAQPAAQPAPAQARAQQPQQPQPPRQRAPRRDAAATQPPQPQPIQPVQPVDAANGAPAGFHTGPARHASHGPVPANGQPANGAPPLPRTLAATGNGSGRAARAQIPVEPVRSVAAALPEPEPEPEPVYAYFEADPDPEYEPEPAAPEPPQAPPHPQLRLQPTPPEQSLLPMPPAAVSAPMIDQQLAGRITKAMAAARIPPNPIKLANELGISPALMQDTLDALGGFDALWSRLRQDQDAEAPETSVEFYTA